MSGRSSVATVAASRTLGVLFALVGVTLLAGGVWLVAIGGSAYYLIAGLALLAAGVDLVRLRERGAWIYLALVAATALWAVWEAGFDGWALLPRLFGPLLLVIPTLFLLPRLSRRDEAARQTLLISGGAGLLVVALVGVVSFAPAGTAGAWPQTGPAGPASETVTDEWPAYGGTYAAQRYSGLNQINVSNASDLTRAWVAHTRDLPEDMSNNRYGAETTPLKIGDRLYLCTATSILLALDARTGRELWRHDPGVDSDYIPYTAACRGVAYVETAVDASSGGACRARVVVGTLDGRLVAVDAADGSPCSGFGEGGEVDITRDMGDTPPGYVSITSPPTVIRGVIVTGHQVLDGQDRLAPSGVVQGYDAQTGERLWGWDMVRPDWSEGPPPGEVWTRGTPNMWTIASGDEALGLVYLPMGNSAADYVSRTRRPEENEHATSLVAIDVTTGRKVWSFRTVHVDVWDYDLGSQATLIDFPRDDGAIPALVLPSKQGDIYILDRRTGEPLTPVEERPVPQGGVEPDMRTATQPFSLYHTLAKHDLRESDMWGMSPIDQMVCRIQFRLAAYDGIYTPPTADRRFIQYPGYNGGSDWGGVAYDPVNGVLLANYNDMPNYNRLIPREEADRRGLVQRSDPEYDQDNPQDGDPQINTPFAIHVNAGWRLPFTDLLCKQPPYGGLRAIDIRDGRTIWDRPFGSAHNNGPFGIPSQLPFRIGTPNNGGGVVTAGGLLFIAATTDNHLRAIDIRTGKTLWKDKLPAGGQSTPMTYAIDGRQYVVIMTGGHHFMETPIGDQVIAYAIP